MKNFFSKILNKIKNMTFYKKKLFYIILVAVFSVLLVANLLIMVLVPNTSGFGSFAGMSGISTDVQGSFDVSDIEDMTLSGDDSTGSSDTDSSSESADDTSSDDSASSDDASAADSDSSDSSEEAFSADMGSMPSGGMPDSGDSSSDDASSDTSSMPDMSGDTSSMPDMSEMADGSTFDADSSDTSDTSSDDASAEGESAASDEDVQAGFSAEDTSSASTVFSVIAFLQGIRSHALLIAVILAVLDIASIVMLIIISRRQKKAAEASLKEQAKEEGRVYIKKPAVQHKHNSKWTLIVAVIVVAVIVLVVKFISTASSATEGTQTEASDLSGTAEVTSIDTTLPGTGTLTEEDAVEQTLIDGVEITKWYVSNDDTVEEGDTLAKVDLTSVMTAIVSVQESLEALDDEIEEHEDEEISDTITATADGRVKAIYAEEDASVVDTMYENGALVILSIDGLMAVELETDAVSTGDSVTVILSDDSEVTGNVESVINGTAVITISDDGPEIGESVTVYTEDGDEVGSGELYIHSELKITGFSGTVEDISVSVEDEVDAGDTLLTLTDTDYTAEYDALVEQRTELEEQLAELFELYSTGYIYAETSGVISGISDTTSDDDDDDSSDSSDDDTDSSDSSDSSDTDDTASADTTASASSASASLTASVRASASAGVKTAVNLVTLSSELTAETSDETDETEETDEYIIGYILSAEETDDGCSVAIFTLDGKAEVTISSDRVIYTYDGESFIEADLESLIVGSVIFYTSDEEQTIYVFSLNVTSDDDSETEDTQEDETTDETAQDSGSSDTSDDSTADMQSSEGTGSEEYNSGDSSGTDDSSSSGSNSSDDTSAMQDMMSSADGSTSDTTASGDTSQSTADMSASVDASSALDSTSAADTSSEDTSVTTSDAVSTSYSVSESTICSVTPQDTMTITITVDELDILSLEEGQSAQVTLDALPGQSFEGTVTAVNTSGSNSGGSSKYTAEITIEKNDSMLAGMNASVSIVLETTEDVLVVSADALFEEDSVTYIYTSFDEETGTYGDAVEVTTGISDGTNVEITSGLSEGDTYYYSYLDTVNYTTTTITSSGFSFTMGGF